MRRLIPLIALCLLALTAAGCANKDPTQIDQRQQLLAQANNALDAAASEVAGLQREIKALRAAIAAEPQGSEKFQSLERQLAVREEELGTAQIYLRFAQVFARALARAPTTAPTPGPSP